MRFASVVNVAVFGVLVAALAGAGPADARVNQSTTSSPPSTATPPPAAHAAAPTPRAQPSPAPRASSSASPSTCSVAVLDLEPQGLGPDESHLPRVLTEALASSVAAASGCEVVTRADIASMIGFEAERQACGGDLSDSCLADIGSALGVERIVGGSIARLGRATTVTARLMNLKVGRVERRAERTVDDAGHLREAAQEVGRALFGATTTSSSSSLLWGGAATAATGLVLAGGGALVVWGADATLASATAVRADKDLARAVGVPAVIVAGAGVVVAGVGGGIVALAGE